MSDRGQNIEHPGIIERIEENKIWVNIQPQSACGNCHSKSYCGMAESADKVVEVQRPAWANTLQAGDTVIISLKKSLGYRALMLGYLLPFLIMLISLIITLSISGREALAALVAISLTIVYYFLLYHRRESIRSGFRFYLKP